MKAMRTRSGPWTLASRAALGLAMLWLVVDARGQGARGISTPLYVGNVVPIQDEFGRPMRGSPVDPASRPRIEIRAAHTNAGYAGVYPPGGTNDNYSHYGNASPLNPLVTEDIQIGVGMNAARANIGVFCAVLPKRPATGTKIFARVFNAPTPQDSTFYADSGIWTVGSNDVTVALVFTNWVPMMVNSDTREPGDRDGDGLNDSWEQLLGTIDRDTPDYDGDGMPDLHEWWAGTDLDDPDSKLSFRAVRAEESTVVRGADGEPARVVRVTWQSVPGKKYRLEYVPMLGAIDPETGEPIAFSADLDGDGFDDDAIVAGENEYEIDVWVGVSTNATGTFRVKLVRE